jgi:hypothetical protein
MEILFRDVVASGNRSWASTQDFTPAELHDVVVDDLDEQGGLMVF